MNAHSALSKSPDPESILGNASFYLAEQYPFTKNDVLRKTPERRAIEIILAVKDIITLANWIV